MNKKEKEARAYLNSTGLPYTALPATPNPTDSMTAATELRKEFGELINWADARNMIERERDYLLDDAKMRGHRASPAAFMSATVEAYRLIRGWIRESEEFGVDLGWVSIASYIASHRIAGAWAVFIGRAIAEAKTPQPDASIPQIAIGCDGGLVQWVIADTPVRFAMLDFDVEGVDESDLTTIPPVPEDPTDSEAPAYAYWADAAVLPKRTQQLIKTVEEKEKEKERK